MSCVSRCTPIYVSINEIGIEIQAIEEVAEKYGFQRVKCTEEEKEYHIFILNHVVIMDGRNYTELYVIN